MMILPIFLIFLSNYMGKIGHFQFAIEHNVTKELAIATR
jgi:hypothetical protein